MHCCLHVPEIVHMICEDLHRMPGYKHSLAAFAGTCRFFQEPALNVLWATLPCIAPLVMCLPPDTLSTDSSGEMVIDKPITLAACVRFSENARRVRTLDIGIEHFDLHGGPCVHPIVYDILSVVFMGRCLLPNIRTLRWFPRDSPGLISYIHLFMGPKLKAIHFDIGPSDTLPLSLLAGLNTRYPSLECLEVTASHVSTSTKYVWDVSTAVCGFRNLRVLKVPGLTYAASEYIANLPGLTSLSLDDQEVFAIAQATTFPELRALSLGCRTPELLGNALRAISSRSLEALDIHAIISDESNIEYFFEDVKKYCDLSALHTITFFNTMIGQAGNGATRRILRTLGVDKYVIRPKVLHPLLSFPNLTEVDLDPVGSFDLDDAAVKDMAMAWPHVRRLSLGSRYASWVRARVTLFGLLPIAEHCRNIEFLSITLDACSGIKRGVIPQTRGIVNRQLVTLKVGNSPIEEPLPVTTFLRQVFPEIVDVLTPDLEVYDENEEEEPELSLSHKLWDRVQDYVSLLAYARTE